MRRYRTTRLATLVMAALAVGCSGDGTTEPTTDSAIEPFVGTWDAEVILITSDADTTQVADLMINGAFHINVQPSGTYTATLSFGGIPLVEIGQLSVGNGVITLRPNDGNAATSTYTFVTDTYLQIDGPTDFDFNLDGELDPAQLYMEWRRR